MSYISRDPIPLTASVVISGVFIAGYEYMIAHPAAADSAANGGDADADESVFAPVVGMFKDLALGDTAMGLVA